MAQVHLTQHLIERLEPGIYFDEETPGFGIRIGRKRRTYFVRAREAGHYPRVKLGLHPRLTCADARRLAHAKLRQREEGHTIRPVPDAVAAFRAGRLNPETATLEHLCLAFLADHTRTAGDDDARAIRRKKRAWSPAYLRNQTRLATRIVIPAWGPLGVRDLNRRMIKTLLEAQRGPVESNRLQAMISKLLNWAVEEELVDDDDRPSVPRPLYGERARTRVLEPEEIRQLFAALDRIDADPDADREARLLTDCWRLRFLTAQRETALRLLEWRWIDLDSETPRITFPGDALKRRDDQPPHLVPLVGRALAILRRRREAASPMDRYVFGLRPGGTPPDQTRGVPLPLPDFQGKDLRRTATTWLRQHKTPREDVKLLLNHKMGDVTATYDRWDGWDDKRAALIRLDGLLDGVLHPTPAKRAPRRRQPTVVDFPARG